MSANVGKLKAVTPPPFVGMLSVMIQEAETHCQGDLYRLSFTFKCLKAGLARNNPFE